jgi:HK97 family phage major capsid protein
MTLEEKQELIKSATTEEELEARMKEIEEDKEEPEEGTEEVKEKKEESGEITPEEERKLIADTQELEKRNKDVSKLKKIGGNEMEKEERKFDLSSKEYRSAWAKKVMGYAEEKFTEDEKRALGDAVTTTATEFVASTANTQGINNGGLFIPTSVREEFMERLSEMSPIYRDVRKLQVNGIIDLPYVDSADNAKWYAELTDTENEGIEFKSIQLTGWELAKDVVITWKLEEMAVESFIEFILDELTEKMGEALIDAVIYGDGSGKPTGITHGLTPVKEGATPIDCLINTYKSLNQKARRGAKGYISTNVNIDIVGYKDKNGNYPFLQGLATNKLVSVEVDPYLKDEDIVVGNCKKYILNENTPLRIDREKTVKGRKTTYGGYSIYDGKAKPNSFAYGQYTPSKAGV